MPDFLVSYDIDSREPNNHKAMVDAAATKGWSYVFKSTDGKLKRLPDTTLWGVFENKQKALDQFKAAIAAANQQPKTKFALEKLALSIFEQRIVISNKEKTPDPKLVGANNIATCLNHQANDKFFIY